MITHIINKYGTIIKAEKNGWNITLEDGTNYFANYKAGEDGYTINSFSLSPFDNIKHIPKEHRDLLTVDNYCVLKEKSFLDKIFDKFSDEEVITFEHWRNLIKLNRAIAFERHCWEIEKYGGYLEDEDEEEFATAIKRTKDLQKEYIDKYGELSNNKFTLDISKYNLKKYRIKEIK